MRRLRQTLGDPLFVRAPSGVTFTPFAEAILPAVREALQGIERGVLERQVFTPATLARTFVVRTTDMRHH